MMRNTLGQIFGTGTSLHYTAPSPALISNRQIGIELEYENVRGPLLMNIDRRLWDTTTDGSLRIITEGSVSPELRFMSPMAGMAVEMALDNLTKCLAKEKDILCSHRAGLHVHVDVRDFNLNKMRNFLITYLIVEPLLYKYVKANRSNNIFCIPLYKTPSYISHYFSLDMFRNAYSFERSIERTRKYSGFNMGSIGTRGSVEFRMHPTTTDMQEVIVWVNLLLSIAEYAFSNKIKIRNLLKYAEDVPNAIVYDVFKDLTHMLDLSSIDSDIETGVNSVYSIINSSELRVSTNLLFNKNNKAEIRTLSAELSLQEANPTPSEPRLRIRTPTGLEMNTEATLEDANRRMAAALAHVVGSEAVTPTTMVTTSASYRGDLTFNSYDGSDTTDEDF